MRQLKTVPVVLLSDLSDEGVSDKRQKEALFLSLCGAEAPQK